MEEIFSWIFKTFPNLEGKIAWNQPMFINHNTFIIGFSYSKKHISVAIEKLALDKFSKDIEKAGYSQSLMLFYINWDQKTNYDLLKKMIEFNIQDKKDCLTFWRK